MKIDIVFSDIDGTLLDSEKRLSDTTIDTFERIKDKTPIVLISSRMPSAMYHLQKSANIDHFPTIAYNGGLIIHDKKILIDQFIPTTIIQDLVNYNKDLDVHISLFNNDDWYVPRNDYCCLLYTSPSPRDA